MASQTFTDLKNRTWTVAITVGDIRPVKARTGIEVGKLTADGCEPLTALLLDPCAFCDVLCVLLADQFKAAGIDDMEFARAMAGDPLEHAAAAFMEALAVFSPRHLRDLTRTVAKKTRAVADLAEARARKVCAKLDAMTPEEVETLNRSAGGSPESLASILDPSPSAN